MTDPRRQTSEPWEPEYTDGAFHIETAPNGWSVYDAFTGRTTLYFATDTEAINACSALSVAAEYGGPDGLDAEYVVQRELARASYRPNA